MHRPLLVVKHLFWSGVEEWCLYRLYGFYLFCSDSPHLCFPQSLRDLHLVMWSPLCTLKMSWTALAVISWKSNNWHQCWYGNFHLQLWDCRFACKCVDIHQDIHSFPQHLMFLNDVNNDNINCSYSSTDFLLVVHHELLCGFRSRRGWPVSFRQLWTSAPAPNLLTVWQQPISSICCCPSLSWARLCCTLPSSRTFHSYHPHSPHSLLSLPSLRSTAWLVRSHTHTAKK